VKRETIGISVILAGMLIGGVGGMATSEAMGQKSKPKSTVQISGTVQSISREPKAPVLTMRTSMGRTVSLQVNPKKVLVMRKGGQRVAWDQVRIGDALRVDFYEERGKHHATVLRIDPMPATGATKPAASPARKK